MVGLVGGSPLPHPVFPLPAVCCVPGLSCPLLPGCLHTLATQPASFFILSHFLPLQLLKSPSLWVRSGRWGVRMGGPPTMHLSPPLPLRSEASLRPSPRTAERWGISSPSASMPSTPSWTPGSSSFSERPSSSASSSGCVACVLVLSTGICRRPFPSPHWGEETHQLLLLSRLRKGAGWPCRPGARDRWHR